MTKITRTQFDLLRAVSFTLFLATLGGVAMGGLGLVDPLFMDAVIGETSTSLIQDRVFFGFLLIVSGFLAFVFSKVIDLHMGVVPEAAAAVHYNEITKKHTIYRPSEDYPEWFDLKWVSLIPKRASVGPYNLTWKPSLENLELFVECQPIEELRSLYATNPKTDFEEYAPQLGIEITRVDPPLRGQKLAVKEEQTIIDLFHSLVTRFQGVAGGVAAFEEAFQREILDRYAAIFDAHPLLRERLIQLKDDALLRLLEKMTR